MIIAKIPRLLRYCFRSLIWRFPEDEKIVYLTFDDGPTPEITEWVLEQLEKFEAKATFFCLGKNVEAHPSIFNMIKEKGHAIGNHSYSHLKGFRFKAKSYKANVDKAAEVIDSRLFRPPYGRIRRSQVNLLKADYDIVMWSVLSVDYDRKLRPEVVIKNVTDNVKAGSVIVFHDSMKAQKNLFQALPEVLKYLQAEGYSMRSIQLRGDEEVS